MPFATALVPVNLSQSPLGLPSCISQSLGKHSILQHTLLRISRIESVKNIILIHPADQDITPLLPTRKLPKPIQTFAFTPAPDPTLTMRTIARRWAMTAWRGGLGGAVCYDELLPAQPLLDALQQSDSDSAFIAGPDWPLLDPDLSQSILALHLNEPQAMAFTFSQAPPGLAGIAISKTILQQMAEKHASFGQLLAYNPQKPQGDPIGRDVCIQIPGHIRNLPHRFIADNPRSLALLNLLSQSLGDHLASASAQTIAQTIHQLPHDTFRKLHPLPQQVTLEITPNRPATGPITPHHHLSLNRPDITLDQAKHLFSQLAQQPDTLLTLGGLGDALLHPQWQQIVSLAHQHGIFSIAIDTDLHCSHETIDQILQLPIDVITIRLNADNPTLYQSVMGVDAFQKVIDNMTHLFNHRNHRASQGTGSLGVPWILPRMVKTAQTLPDMEMFFDKWTHFMGHAVIEPPTTGCGLIPNQEIIRMAPPKPSPCRQLQRRMTILSNAQPALCDQDWLGHPPTSSTTTCATSSATATVVTTLPANLADTWQHLGKTLALQQANQWEELPLCNQCSQWHRP